MIRRCYRLVYSLIFLLAMAVNVSADTTMSGGPITADTTWAVSGSPYIVNGSVLVMKGVTLTIEPGVEIRFGEGNSFQVDGMLIAKGTESQKITFTANNSGVNWGYLLFSTSSTDATYDTDGNYTGGSILRHCIIEYAGGADVSNNGAVRLDNAHPFFNHVTIRNNKASGIYAWDISGTLKIINSTISDNDSSGSDGGGIDVDAKGIGSTVYISNSTIDNNIGRYGGGINLDSQNVTLKDNTITNNTASKYGGGIHLSSDGNVTLKDNTVTDNTAGENGGGISLSSDNSIVENNTMTDNTAKKGGGIYSHNGKATISNNTIKNNTATDDVGGASLRSYGINFFDNTVSNNTAKNSIGGVYIGYGTVSNNVISENSAANGTGAISLEYATVTNNTIDGNSGLNGIVTIRSSGTFQYNAITNNLTAKSADITSTIWVDASHPLIKYNNIFGNTATYELWHNNKHGSDNVNAENNWWGTNDESAILAKIHDFFDDSEKGIVSYAPWESAIRTDAGVQDTTTPPPPPPSDPDLITLAINKVGNGNITGNGIDCGSVCAKEYAKGTAVTLTATPTGEFLFAGWNGAGCSGTGNCTMTLSDNQTVTATFNEKPEKPPATTTFTLTVNKLGTGDVTGNGFDCGSVCTKEYNEGTEVTLTATPVGETFFVGWSGAGCSGTGNCTVTMNESQTVTATFRPPATLSVNTNGNGTVTGVGIDCGSDCSETFEKGKQITLKAIADGDYVFDDWSGECSGKAFCTITMNADKTMTANFTLPKTTLTVNREGNGTVESSPSGINCGSDCEERYDTTDEITLTAEPKAGYSFEEWEGDCDLVNSADDCIVTMETDKEVTAIFTAQDPEPDVIHLEFRGLKDLYQVGETLVMELVETVNKDKYTRVDLWVAIELPSRDFLFRTEIPLTPWHPNMQPHKTSIENTETSHHIFDFEVPEGIGGDYTLYAAYVKEGENPVTNGFSIRSNLVVRQIFLGNRKD